MGRQTTDRPMILLAAKAGAAKGLTSVLSPEPDLATQPKSLKPSQIYTLALGKEVELRERGRSHKRENTQRVETTRRDQPLPSSQQGLIREIDTIIGGPHPSKNSNNSEKKYIEEAKEPTNVNYCLHTYPVGTERNDPITFNLYDVSGVHFSHNDALVVRAIVARNGLGRMLVDNKSSVNIIYGTTYDKMGIDIPMTLATYPIYGFTGDSIILMTKMGEAPKRVRILMEYLVVDISSSYHGVLEMPALIDLEAVTHMKFLCMKFSTEHGIATVKENQSETQACYTNAMRKFIDLGVNVINVEMKEALSGPKRLDEGNTEEDEQMVEQENPEDLDP
ncbi:Uncharacterized protein Adt_03957 [Abeliophyllum distichum]|uniref:Uncharacterized protein n=1 Tax=Abeliophyllum distichum TaxID=126358 RepID=A0ABD1VZZ7_9LAMI